MTLTHVAGQWFAECSTCRAGRGFATEPAAHAWTTTHVCKGAK